MSLSLDAARKCASTLLFQSLRVDAFTGAVPHVMIVVDRQPCVLQKVLVEGYRQVLQELNGAAPKAVSGPLFIPLSPSDTPTPCGAAGLFGAAAARVSYSVIPFECETFLADMRRLRSFFRLCGTGAGSSPSAAFDEEFDSVRRYLLPFPQDGDGGVAADRMASALREGPLREMLGFILVQRNAFQNEMGRYRLRLTLFDLGMRVAEHCHLECMSARADALAAGGDEGAALADDEVYSYARSCAFPPAVAECLGRAIADSIDQFAWQRETGEPSAAPPPSFGAALSSPAVWQLFAAGALVWRGGDAAAARPADPEALRRAPITAAGAPLRILCEEEGQCLSFSGGMEDCLLNTGFYAASERAERNDVHQHRALFPCAAEPGPGRGPTPEPEGAGEGRTMGRMKKKEYLAHLRETGQRPNKKKPRLESDEDEAGTQRACGAAINTSIGGTFPVGEVISESFDLSQLSGTCSVFAYPDLHKLVAMAKPRPFTMTIEAGVVTGVGADAPEEFADLLSLVRQAEGACYVRELGIGLNPYVGLAHVVSDVTAFERQWGVHLSLGQRHPLFVKQGAKCNADGTVVAGVSVVGPVLKRKAGKFHIDVFVHATKLAIGDFELDFTKGVATA